MLDQLVCKTCCQNIKPVKARKKARDDVSLEYRYKDAKQPLRKIFMVLH